jgi:hypothetical protein
MGEVTGVSQPAGTSGSELATRVVISLVACGLVTWQLAETANFRPDTTWLTTSTRMGCCKRLGGTPLQWYLVSLMCLSALDGLVGVLVDLFLLVSEDGSNNVPLSKVTEEIGVQLVLGKLSQLILSLMIIGLGVNSWRPGAPLQDAAGAPRAAVARGYAQAATALGVLSLIVHRLPAPLVLVGGVFCLQRTPARRVGGQAGGEDEEACGGCFSLRCALRPLLVLALIEAAYASVNVDDEFRRRMEISKREAHRMVEMQQARAAAQGAESEVVAEAAALQSMLAVFDSLNPETMLEMAQQQLGELVQLGVVVALGVSGKWHGLKHTMWPVAAGMVPGLPTYVASPSWRTPPRAQRAVRTSALFPAPLALSLSPAASSDNGAPPVRPSDPCPPVPAAARSRWSSTSYWRRGRRRAGAPSCRWPRRESKRRARVSHQALAL